MIDHAEIAARRRFAVDRTRAAYFWQVRRWVDDITRVAQSDVLLAEYDVFGGLHRLAEVPPAPFIWCAESYRTGEGVPSRSVPVPAGFEPIWLHRVREGRSFTSEFVAIEDCLIFGRREIFTGREDVLLLYPDGDVVECSSVSAALLHVR
jgi:hypothetical protein